jgi:hypothetical protein
MELPRRGVEHANQVEESLKAHQKQEEAKQAQAAQETTTENPFAGASDAELGKDVDDLFGGL